VAKVREDLPDDGGIVQGGDQPQAAPAVRARQDVNGKRPCIRAAQLQARGGLFSPVPSGPAAWGAAEAVGSGRTRP